MGDVREGSCCQGMFYTYKVTLLVRRAGLAADDFSFGGVYISVCVRLVRVCYKSL